MRLNLNNSIYGDGILFVLFRIFNKNYKASLQGGLN